jgi:predicted transcriptional regulator
VIYKKGTREISVDELSTLLGCGTSNINNVTPTLGVLGLIDIEKRIITITNDGFEFISSYNSDKIEIAREIIRKAMHESEALRFVKSLLDTRVQLTGEEIGRSVSDRFGKNWKNVLSYRSFGNSCASILGFAGVGYYNDGVLSLKPITTKSEAEFYPPEVGYQPIIRLLNALYPFERAKGSDLAKKLKAKESRVAKELSVCVTLGLVEKNVTGGYSVSERGRKLIDPRSASDAKAQVFLECLLHSPYAEIISKLTQTDKELTYESIGESIAYDLRRDWASLSKQIYGKKFVTWLNGANLLEKSGPNNFGLKKSEISNAIKKEEEKTSSKQVKEIYEIGRVLGGLEVIIPVEENKKEFEDRISVLRSMFKEHGDLDLVFDLLRKNFQLSLESKNVSIYRTNIEFVRDKIKEKLGISTI